MKASIKIEIVVGTDIEQAYKEAVRLATALNVYIEFDFNGVHCLAHPNGNPAVGAEHCRRVLAYGMEHAFATT